jgi:hypothetical protein
VKRAVSDASWTRSAQAWTSATSAEPAHRTKLHSKARPWPDPNPDPRGANFGDLWPGSQRSRWRRPQVFEGEVSHGAPEKEG